MRCNLRTSCKPVFKNLRLLTVPCIYILETLKMVHKNPVIFGKYKFSHDHNTRKGNVFQYPTHQLKKYESSPLYMGLKMYNHLPKYYRDLTPSIFVRNVKEKLFRKAYYSLGEYFDDHFE